MDVTIAVDNVPIVCVGFVVIPHVPTLRVPTTIPTAIGVLLRISSSPRGPNERVNSEGAIARRMGVSSQSSSLFGF